MCDLSIVVTVRNGFLFDFLFTVDLCFVVYFVTWFSEESHAEVDVVLSIADVLTSVLQKPYDALAHDVKEES